MNVFHACHVSLPEHASTGHSAVCDMRLNREYLWDINVLS